MQAQIIFTEKKEHILRILLFALLMLCISSGCVQALHTDPTLNVTLHWPLKKFSYADAGSWLAPRGKSAKHLGVDMFASTGWPVAAVADGSVYAISKNGWGRGNAAVLIKHTLPGRQWFIALYGNIAEASAPRQGDRVSAGQCIGKIGKPQSGQAHLHFGVAEPGTVPGPAYNSSRKNSRNNFIDPIHFLQSGAVPLIVNSSGGGRSSSSSLPTFSGSGKTRVSAREVQHSQPEFPPSSASPPTFPPTFTGSGKTRVSAPETTKAAPKSIPISKPEIPPSSEGIPIFTACTKTRVCTPEPAKAVRRATPQAAPKSTLRSKPVIQRPKPTVQRRSKGVMYWPLDRFRYSINRNTGGWLARRGRRRHLAVDMFVPVGRQVRAVADGIVYEVSGNGWGGGNVALLIRHELGGGRWFVALYGHVQRRGAARKGRKVSAGEVIARVGHHPSSHSHLHFGVVLPGRQPRAPYGNSSSRDHNNFINPTGFLERHKARRKR